MTNLEVSPERQQIFDQVWDLISKANLSPADRVAVAIDIMGFMMMQNSMAVRWGALTGLLRSVADGDQIVLAQREKRKSGGVLA